MINCKQFVISKQNIVPNNYNSIKLKNGYTLSWEKNLNIYYNKNRNIVLLGTAYQVDTNRESPIDELKKIDSQEYIEESVVLSMEYSWCGRYVLIVNSKIYLDATGLLGVFYSKNYVSSSLSMLCNIEHRKIVYPKIQQGLHPDYFPGRNTYYNDIKRLLPSQIYNYETQELEFRKLLPNGIYFEKSVSERTQILEKYFINSLKNLKKQFNDKKFLLALTGGRDSRTTMAFLEKSNIDYSTFTLEHKDISEGDIEIPKQLSEILKKDYVFIKAGKKYSQKRKKEFEEHTAGYCVEQDKYFYARFQYDQLTHRGKCFGVKKWYI